MYIETSRILTPHIAQMPFAEWQIRLAERRARGSRRSTKERSHQTLLVGALVAIVRPLQVDHPAADPAATRVRIQLGSQGRLLWRDDLPRDTHRDSRRGGGRRRGKRSGRGNRRSGSCDGRSIPPDLGTDHLCQLLLTCLVARREDVSVKEERPFRVVLSHTFRTPSPNQTEKK